MHASSAASRGNLRPSSDSRTLPPMSEQPPLERILDTLFVIVVACAAFVLVGRWALKQIFGL